jgi:sodium transport system permease protein
MNPALTVFIKECRESLRDRRVLLNALVLGPLLGPVLFVLLLRVTISRQIERAAAPLPVAIIGAARAPNLVSALQQQGIRVLPAVADPEAAVRAQRLDVALRIPASFAADWRAGQPAQLQIVFDSSRRDSEAAAARLRATLQAYSARTAAMRLMARGLAPTLSAPLVVATRDQATAQGRGALLFAMLPYLLILSALIGGVWLAIDSTAGERERASLEPLLINPVPRDRILLGKLLATAAFSLASLTLSLLAFALAGHFLPTRELDMTFDLGPLVTAAILPLMLPLVLLIVAAQILVTAFARSAREAQTYLGLLQLLPLIPSVLLSVLPLRAQLWMYAVPLLGQQLDIMQLLRGEPVTAPQALLATLTTLLAAFATFLAARRSYETERLAIAA